MMEIIPNYVEIDESALDLLAVNVTNELINGIKVQDFDTVVGVSRQKYIALAVALGGLPKGQSAKFHLEEARIFRNALEVVMEELGVEEFDTRTGHPYVEGKTILQLLVGFVEMHEGGWE
jgi:hypothetical protein